jgi:putative flippase GtrA
MMNERWWAPKNRFAEIVRFGAAGLANTLFTIGLYELFVEVLGPVTAYAIAWAAGLLLVVVCYPATVYRLEAGLWRRLGLMLSYVVTFCIGIGLTVVLNRIGVAPRLIVLLVAAATAVVNYVSGRWTLRLGGNSRVARHGKLRGGDGAL